MLRSEKSAIGSPNTCDSYPFGISPPSAPNQDTPGAPAPVYNVFRLDGEDTVPDGIRRAGRLRNRLLGRLEIDVRHLPRVDQNRDVVRVIRDHHGGEVRIAVLTPRAETG